MVFIVAVVVVLYYQAATYRPRYVSHHPECLTCLIYMPILTKLSSSLAGRPIAAVPTHSVRAALYGLVKRGTRGK
jgi:hypothetical protein